jgi:MFS family permease
MVQIGSVGGALLAFLTADRIGRLWATRQLCVLWILGIVIFMTNGGRLGQVYAGRFIAGLVSYLTLWHQAELLANYFSGHWPNHRCGACLYC